MREQKQYLDTEAEVEAYHDNWWGHRKVVLTELDFERLRNGQYIMFNDGEYSTQIQMEGSEEDSHTDTSMDSDAQATPGPLEVQDLDVIREDPLRPDEHWVVASFSITAPAHPEVEGTDQDVLGMGEATAKKNAYLYATAINALSRIPEDSDPIEVLENLPEIISLAQRAVDETTFREDGDLPTSSPPNRSTLKLLQEALAPLNNQDPDG